MQPLPCNHTPVAESHGLFRTGSLPMAIRFDSFLHRFKGELVVGNVPSASTPTLSPHPRISCPYPVAYCAVPLLSLNSSNPSPRLSLTFIFFFSIPLSTSSLTSIFLTFSTLFIMPFRTHSLIGVVALCEFNSGFIVWWKGAEILRRRRDVLTHDNFCIYRSRYVRPKSRR